jgi:hypothetical protein
MHRAPAVNFLVKRSRWHVKLIVCLTLLAVAALSAFASRQALLNVQIFLLAAVILITSVIAFLGWKQSPKGTLRWDGQHWFWSNFATNSECRLQLLMDFQRLVLVSIEAEGRTRAYLWLETMHGNTHWKSLRRAIVSSQVLIEDTRKVNTLPVEGDLS